MGKCPRPYQLSERYVNIICALTARHKTTSEWLRTLPRLQTSKSPKESGHESFWSENCGPDHLFL